MLKRYEEKICQIDHSVLSKDEYCFSVLKRILTDRCRLTITDGKRIIICHSADPYPVWIWLADDASTDEIALAYDITKSNFGFGGKYRFNMKYETAEKFISLAQADEITLRISTNMHSYSCTSPITPTRKASGECRLADIEDLDMIIGYMDKFHEEMGIDKTDLNSYRERALKLISDKHLFLWWDGGEAVAMTSYDLFDNKGRVGNVYTRSDKRRLGYAASLVYTVTNIIVETQKMESILYTDADYAASNACYEKIGYVRRGSLCTLK